MATRQIRELFNGRYFEIPKYQRGYAWERKNIRELFDDIYESLESNSNHYIGTVVLSKHPKHSDQYYVVDGQQRIATITMIFKAIIDHLPKSDANYYYRFYIQEEKHRLSMLGRDKDFLLATLSQKKREPENKSQRLLREAYEEIQAVVAKEKNLMSLLKSIEKLEMMEFIESSEGDAIRIFQTVNDRGKPLSNMEKAKSLLIYFSNRYLDKKLDDAINDAFGEMFEMYDDIKALGEILEINLISNVDFNEDNIMRYHFVTFSEENYDATAGYVLDFLKRNLGQLRSDGRKSNFKKLENFIQSYVESLHGFFRAMSVLIKKASEKAEYFRLFSVLGLSATLYPLVAKLEMLGLLDKKLPGKSYNESTFLDLMELIDVRVYKTKGTDPRAEISRVSCQINSSWTQQQIRDWLIGYNRSKMPKESFQLYLKEDVYGNRALPHMFISYCEFLEGQPFDLESLNRIAKTGPTIEHILSQNPKFSASSFGFSNYEEFIEFEHKLGNLTLLEEKLNKAIQNKNPIDKVPSYDKSKLKITKGLSTSIAKQKLFSKDDILKRGEELVKFCTTKWWC